jgi:hypothetical protein
VLTESHVRTAVLFWLRRKGYAITDPKEQAEHGVDIRARHLKYPRYFLVETKGDPIKSKKPDGTRTSCFWVAVGQIATRMDTSALYHYGIAFPDTFHKKVVNLPWQFCKKNRLSIFLVDENKKVKHLTWKDLKTRRR